MQHMLIYEDNPRLRQSLQLLLDDGVNFTIDGAYEQCKDVLQHLENSEVSLIIMDIDMPGITGIDGVKLVKANYPDVRVVMFTVFDDNERIFEAICNGADGYLLKNTPPAKIVHALQSVLEGDRPMSPFVAQKVFNHFKKEDTSQKVNYNLSKSELEILELLVKGNSYKMIAAQTYIVVDTVKRHLQNIYHKLHVNCGTEAVAKAIQHKIVLQSD